MLGELTKQYITSRQEALDPGLKHCLVPDARLRSPAKWKREITFSLMDRVTLEDGRERGVD